MNHPNIILIGSGFYSGLSDQIVPISRTGVELSSTYIGCFVRYISFTAPSNFGFNVSCSANDTDSIKIQLQLVNATNNQIYVRVLVIFQNDILTLYNN